MAEIVSSTDTTKAEQKLLDLIAQVRLFTRDYRELNRLTAGEESSERMIAWAIQDAVDDWNSSPPDTGRVTILNHPSTSLLIRGSVISLIESVGLLQTRNHLTYSDGSGASVNVSDKTPLLQSWISLFSARYEQKKQRLKIAINIDNAWGGGVGSEFSLINAYYSFGE